MISRTTLRDNQSWTAHIANPKFARRPRALQARCLVRYASRPVVLSLGFVFRQNDRVAFAFSFYYSSSPRLLESPTGSSLHCRYSSFHFSPFLRLLFFLWRRIFFFLLFLLTTHVLLLLLVSPTVQSRECDAAELAAFTAAFNCSAVEEMRSR